MMRTSLLLLTALGACTEADSDPGPGPIDEVTIVGSWRQRLPQGEQQDLGYIDEIVFREDGTYSSTPASAGSGMYELIGDRLRTGNTSSYRETEYTRRNELLVVYGLRPVGEVVDLVGVWQGVEIFVSPNEHVEAHWGLELRADGTAHYSLANTNQDFDREGTWMLHTDGLWLRFQATDPGGALGLYFAILGDNALGKYSFMKID